MIAAESTGTTGGEGAPRPRADTTTPRTASGRWSAFCSHFGIEMRKSAIAFISSNRGGAHLPSLHLSFLLSDFLLLLFLCFLPTFFSPSFQKEDQGINIGNKGKVRDPKGLQARAPPGHRTLMVEQKRTESRGPGCANTSGRELGVS